MHGIWVGLSISVSETKIKQLLERWFPALEILTLDEALRSDRSPWPPIVFSVENRKNVDDFPIYIGFDCFPGPNDQAVAVGIVLAKRLATAFACRALCDGSGLGDDETPYWSIVWEQGRSFLADDSGTQFADGTGGPVRVARELQLPGFDLDEQGALTHSV
jgi:hypothetical protein